MTVKIEDLKNGDSFKNDLLLDKKFLILPKTAEMPEEFIKALKNWDFREIMYEEEGEKAIKQNDNNPIIPPPPPQKNTLQILLKSRTQPQMQVENKLLLT
ncbi:MAG: hypothetical protein HDR54_02425 [Treponema sp.]|nr:hypothetical protein [Treponema sp.]